MIVELSKAKVTIKDDLSWGDAERIQSALLKTAKIAGLDNETSFELDTDAMLEAKYMVLERLVIEVDQGGVKSKWSREWQDNLSMKDGNTLFDAVDGVSKKERGIVSV